MKYIWINIKTGNLVLTNLGGYNTSHVIDNNVRYEYIGKL